MTTDYIRERLGVEKKENGAKYGALRHTIQQERWDGFITQNRDNQQLIQNMTLYKLCKTYYQHNPKVSSFGIALVKKWQVKFRDAGTTDRFHLAFQYHIFKNIKKNGQKQSQLKNSLLCKCVKANTSPIWQHVLHIQPTKVKNRKQRWLLAFKETNQNTQEVKLKKTK